MKTNLHNAYLKEMGIDVWLERRTSNLNSAMDSSLKAEFLPPENMKTEPQVESHIIEPLSEIKNHPEKKDVEALDWQALASTVSACQLCELSETRKQTVFGMGKQTAPLMIIGDAPDEEDEKQGAVFTGQAGKLLTAMLKAMGYQRNEVYISNIVKCKTLQNQEPSDESVSACAPYLIRQINLLQPKLILALGSITAQKLLKSKSTMGRLRGQLHYVENINAPVLVSYHPTYLLAAPNEKRKAWEDLQMAMKVLTVTEASA